MSYFITSCITDLFRRGYCLKQHVLKDTLSINSNKMFLGFPRSGPGLLIDFYEGPGQKYGFMTASEKSHFL